MSHLLNLILRVFNEMLMCYLFNINKYYMNVFVLLKKLNTRVTYSLVPNFSLSPSFITQKWLASLFSNLALDLLFLLSLISLAWGTGLWSVGLSWWWYKRPPWMIVGERASEGLEMKAWELFFGGVLICCLYFLL